MDSGSAAATAAAPVGTPSASHPARVVHVDREANEASHVVQQRVRLQEELATAAWGTAGTGAPLHMDVIRETVDNLERDRQAAAAPARVVPGLKKEQLRYLQAVAPRLASAREENAQSLEGEAARAAMTTCPALEEHEGAPAPDPRGAGFRAALTREEERQELAETPRAVVKHGESMLMYSALGAATWEVNFPSTGFTNHDAMLLQGMGATNFAGVTLARHQPRLQSDGSTSEPTQSLRNVLGTSWVPPTLRSACASDTKVLQLTEDVLLLCPPASAEVKRWEVHCTRPGMEYQDMLRVGAGEWLHAYHGSSLVTVVTRAGLSARPWYEMLPSGARRDAERLLALHRSPLGVGGLGTAFTLPTRDLARVGTPVTDADKTGAMFFSSTGSLSKHAYHRLLPEHCVPLTPTTVFLWRRTNAGLPTKVRQWRAAEQQYVNQLQQLLPHTEELLWTEGALATPCGAVGIQDSVMPQARTCRGRLRASSIAVHPAHFEAPLCSMRGYAILPVRPEVQPLVGAPAVVMVLNTCLTQFYDDTSRCLTLGALLLGTPLVSWYQVPSRAYRDSLTVLRAVSEKLQAEEGQHLSPADRYLSLSPTQRRRRAATSSMGPLRATPAISSWRVTARLQHGSSVLQERLRRAQQRPAALDASMWAASSKEVLDALEEHGKRAVFPKPAPGPEPGPPSQAEDSKEEVTEEQDSKEEVTEEQDSKEGVTEEQDSKENITEEAEAEAEAEVEEEEEEEDAGFTPEELAQRRRDMLETAMGDAGETVLQRTAGVVEEEEGVDLAVDSEDEEVLLAARWSETQLHSLLRRGLVDRFGLLAAQLPFQQTLIDRLQEAAQTQDDLRESRRGGAQTKNDLEEASSALGGRSTQSAPLQQLHSLFSDLRKRGRVQPAAERAHETVDMGPGLVFTPAKHSSLSLQDRARLDLLLLCLTAPDAVLEVSGETKEEPELSPRRCRAVVVCQNDMSGAIEQTALGPFQPLSLQTLAHFQTCGGTLLIGRHWATGSAALHADARPPTRPELRTEGSRKRHTLDYAHPGLGLRGGLQSSVLMAAARLPARALWWWKTRFPNRRRWLRQTSLFARLRKAPVDIRPEDWALLGYTLQRHRRQVQALPLDRYSRAYALEQLRNDARVSVEALAGPRGDVARFRAARNRSREQRTPAEQKEEPTDASTETEYMPFVVEEAPYGAGPAGSGRTRPPSSAGVNPHEHVQLLLGEGSSSDEHTSPSLPAAGSAAAQAGDRHVPTDRTQRLWQVLTRLRRQTSGFTRLRGGSTAVLPAGRLAEDLATVAAFEEGEEEHKESGASSRRFHRSVLRRLGIGTAAVQPFEAAVAGDSDDSEDLPDLGADRDSVGADSDEEEEAEQFAFALVDPPPEAERVARAHTLPRARDTRFSALNEARADAAGLPGAVVGAAAAAAAITTAATPAAPAGARAQADLPGTNLLERDVARPALADLPVRTTTADAPLSMRYLAFLLRNSTILRGAPSLLTGDAVQDARSSAVEMAARAAQRMVRRRVQLPNLAPRLLDPVDLRAVAALCQDTYTLQTWLDPALHSLTTSRARGLLLSTDELGYATAVLPFLPSFHSLHLDVTDLRSARRLTTALNGTNIIAPQLTFLSCTLKASRACAEVHRPPHDLEAAERTTSITNPARAMEHMRAGLNEKSFWTSNLFRPEITPNLRVFTLRAEPELLHLTLEDAPPLERFAQAATHSVWRARERASVMPSLNVYSVPATVQHLALSNILLRGAAPRGEPLPGDSQGWLTGYMGEGNVPAAPDHPPPAPCDLRVLHLEDCAVQNLEALDAILPTAPRTERYHFDDPGYLYARAALPEEDRACTSLKFITSETLGPGARLFCRARVTEAMRPRCDRTVRGEVDDALPYAASHYIGLAKLLRRYGFRELVTNSLPTMAEWKAFRTRLKLPAEQSGLPLLRSLTLAGTTRGSALPMEVLCTLEHLGFTAGACHAVQLVANAFCHTPYKREARHAVLNLRSLALCVRPDTMTEALISAAALFQKRRTPNLRRVSLELLSGVSGPLAADTEAQWSDLARLLQAVNEHLRQRPELRGPSQLLQATTEALLQCRRRDTAAPAVAAAARAWFVWSTELLTQWHREQSKRSLRAPRQAPPQLHLWHDQLSPGLACPEGLRCALAAMQGFVRHAVDSFHQWGLPARTSRTALNAAAAEVLQATSRTAGPEFLVQLGSSLETGLAAIAPNLLLAPPALALREPDVPHTVGLGGGIPSPLGVALKHDRVLETGRWTPAPMAVSDPAYDPVGRAAAYRQLLQQRLRHAVQLQGALAASGADRLRATLQAMDGPQLYPFGRRALELFFLSEYHLQYHADPRLSQSPPFLMERTPQGPRTPEDLWSTPREAAVGSATTTTPSPVRRMRPRRLTFNHESSPPAAGMRRALAAEVPEMVAPIFNARLQRQILRSRYDLVHFGYASPSLDSVVESVGEEEEEEEEENDGASGSA